MWSLDYVEHCPELPLRMAAVRRQYDNVGLWASINCRKDKCIWLFSLLAFVELPLSSAVCATIRGIYRRLSFYSIESEQLQACVDVLKVICSQYFHQQYCSICNKHNYIGVSFVSTSTVLLFTYNSVSSILTPKCRRSSGTSSLPSNYASSFSLDLT